MSRPMSRSPKPKAQTVAARDPDMSSANTRSVELIVRLSWPESSSDSTVTGRLCDSAGSKGSSAFVSNSAVLVPT
ncbi:unannotated protein [freshwater metagenome]|uniref:Unannotated protein n=1 Tax=freshwater metagenome TaxID=449393 RepID=A0A6J6JWU6_9ZZZZ